MCRARPRKGAGGRFSRTAVAEDEGVARQHLPRLEVRVLRPARRRRAQRQGLRRRRAREDTTPGQRQEAQTREIIIRRRTPPLRLSAEQAAAPRTARSRSAGSAVICFRRNLRASPLEALRGRTSTSQPAGLRQAGGAGGGGARKETQPGWAVEEGCGASTRQKKEDRCFPVQQEEREEAGRRTEGN